LSVPAGLGSAPGNSWIQFSFVRADNVQIARTDWFGVFNGTEETEIISMPPIDQPRTGQIAVSQGTTLDGTIGGATSTPMVTTDVRTILSTATIASGITSQANNVVPTEGVSSTTSSTFSSGVVAGGVIGGLLALSLIKLKRVGFIVGVCLAGAVAFFAVWRSRPKGARGFEGEQSDGEQSEGEQREGEQGPSARLGPELSPHTIPTLNYVEE
jgi:hypothetical protein